MANPDPGKVGEAVRSLSAQAILDAAIALCERVEEGSAEPGTGAILLAASHALAGQSSRRVVAQVQRRIGALKLIDPTLLPALVQRLVLQADAEAFRADIRGSIATHAAVDPARALTLVLEALPDLLRQQRIGDAQYGAEWIVSQQTGPHAASTLELIKRALTSNAGRRLARALTDRDAAVRAATAELLVMLGATVTPLALQSALTTPVSVVRRESARDVLRRCAPPSWLTEQLHPIVFEPRMASILVDAMGHAGARADFASVEPYLTHPDSSVRERALAAAVRLLEQESIRLCYAALNDGAPTVATAAIGHLSRLGDHSAALAEWLLSALRGTEHPLPLRLAAAQALGNFQDTVCSPPLSKRLEATSTWPFWKVWKSGSPLPEPLLREVRFSIARLRE